MNRLQIQNENLECTHPIKIGKIETGWVCCYSCGKKLHKITKK